MSSRVLMLTRCFPPALSVSGKRTYQFARYLPRRHWQPIVVTAPVPRWAQTDDSLPTNPGMRVERCYGPGWWPQPHLRYASSAAALRRPHGLRRILKGLSAPIGRELLLAPYVLPRVARLCREEGVSVIYASGGPAAVLLHGLLAARRARLPLCLDLRDPWTLNYLQRSRPGWVQHVERPIERLLLRSAQRVLFTSETTRDAYRALYPELPSERFVTIYTGYDPHPVPEPAYPAGPITIMHFGNCFGARTLGTVLDGLEQLQQSGQWPAEGIRLINFGRVQESDLKRAESFGRSGVLTIVPPVDYRTGLAALSSADLLLLLGYGDEEGFIPAKTFDYLLVRRPVLCITRCEELGRIIAVTGAGRVVRPGDTHGCAAAIESAIRERSGASQPGRCTVDRSHFSVNVSVEKLATLLDTVVEDWQGRGAEP